MADEATERITILLQAKDAEFQRALEKNNRVIARATKQWEQNTSRATKKIDANLKSAANSAATFGKSFVAGLAIGAATTLFAGMTTGLRSIIGAVADLKDQADQLGLTTQQLQELQYTMKLAGVSADEFGSSMARFTDGIGDALRGGGALKDVLAANGIALRDVAGNVRPTTEILAEFADLIQRTPDEATRMSLITEAFGRAGKAMTLALAGGSEALRQGALDANNMGAVMDSATTEAAARLDDRFDSLTMSLQRFFMESAVGWAAMGEDAWAAITAVKDAFASAMSDSNADVINDAAANMSGALTNALTATLGDANLAGSAAIIAGLGDAVDSLAQDFASGVITEEEFAEKLEDLRTRTRDFLATLQDVNGVDFSAAIAVMDNLGGVIDGLAAKARAAALGIANLAMQGTSTAGAGAVASGGGAIDLTPKPGGGGGGGGGHRGGGSGSSATGDAAHWFEITRTEAERYADDLKELDGLLSAGAITQDTYSRGLDLIKDKYDLASDAGDFMKDTTADLREAFLDAAVDGVNSFDDITRAIKRAALEAALFGTGPMAGIFGKGGRGLFGGIFGGLAGARAKGGPVAGGQSYLVGERGPEIFTPAVAGAITPNGKGGGGTVHVTGGDLVLTDKGQIAARIRVTAQQAGAAAVQAVKSQLPGWQRQFATDGTL